MAAFKENMKTAPGLDTWEKRLKDIEDGTKPSIVSMADVPAEFMEVKFVEGAGDAEELDGTSQSDSIAGRRVSIAAGVPHIKVVATIKAPGVNAAWASAGLKQAMFDGEMFSFTLIQIICSVPHIQDLSADTTGDPLYFIRADLEEFDMPRLPPHLEPAPPVDHSPPPPNFDSSELSRQLPFWRPKILEKPYLDFSGSNGHALADGMRRALPEGGAHLLELHLWCCKLGDEGAAAIAGALDAGCGPLLHTVLFDDNDIGVLGGTALGAGFKACREIREVNICRNPVKGIGFRALIGGLSSSLVLLDACQACLDDKAAKSLGVALRRWTAVSTLKLSGNPEITPKGAEVLARGLLTSPQLRCIDVKGCTIGVDAPRLRHMLGASGVDQSKLII